MQTHGITFDDVATIANKLTEMGAPVTTKSIRAELGTGSQSTITKHLRTWRESIAEKAEAILGDTVPKELVAAIAIELKKAGTVAKNELLEKISTTEKALDEVTEILAKEEEIGDKLRNELHSVSFEKEKIASKVAELEEKNNSLTRTNREVSQLYQKMREDFASSTTAYDYINKELERQIGFLKVEREARLKAEIELAKLQGKIGTH